MTKEYEVSLAEREPPPSREGMTFKVTIRRNSRRAAAAGFADKFIVVAVRLIAASQSRMTA